MNDLDQPRTDTDTRADARPRGDADRPEHHERARLEVSGTQVCASALASVSAAVIGSFFGVTDTLVGAAIASVVATLGSAVYGLWIRRGSQKLKDVEVTRLTSLARVGPVTPSARRAAGDTAAPTAAPTARAAKDGNDDEHEPPAWWAWLSRRRRSALAGVAIVFLLTVGIITAIELLAQRPLAGVSDGDSSGMTSIGQVFRGSSDSGPGSEADEPGATTTSTVGTGPSTSGGEPDAPAGSDTEATTTTAEADSSSDAPETQDGTTTTSGASTTSTTSATDPAPSPADGTGTGSGSGGSGSSAGAPAGA